MAKQFPKPIWRVMEPPEDHVPGGPGMKRTVYSHRSEVRVRSKLDELREKFPGRTFQLYKGIFPADE